MQTTLQLKMENKILRKLLEFYYNKLHDGSKVDFVNGNLDSIQAAIIIQSVEPFKVNR